MIEQQAKSWVEIYHEACRLGMDPMAAPNGSNGTQTVKHFMQTKCDEVLQLRDQLKRIRELSMLDIKSTPAIAPVEKSPTRTGPAKNNAVYQPQEYPTRYPLELTPDLHICLWDSAGEYRYTIAYFRDDKEGSELHFVGDRPLNERVNWSHFRELVQQGQSLANLRFEEMKAVK